MVIYLHDAPQTNISLYTMSKHKYDHLGSNLQHVMEMGVSIETLAHTIHLELRLMHIGRCISILPPG